MLCLNHVLRDLDKMWGIVRQCELINKNSYSLRTSFVTFVFLFSEVFFLFQISVSRIIQFLIKNPITLNQMISGNFYLLVDLFLTTLFLGMRSGGLSAKERELEPLHTRQRLRRHPNLKLNKHLRVRLYRSPNLTQNKIRSWMWLYSRNTSVWFWMNMPSSLNCQQKWQLILD